MTRALRLWRPMSKVVIAVALALTYSPDQIVNYGLSAQLLDKLINQQIPEYYAETTGSYTTHWGTTKHYTNYTAEYASYIGPQNLNAQQWNSYTSDEQGSYASETYDSNWFQTPPIYNYLSNAPSASTTYQVSSDGSMYGVGPSLEHQDAYYSLTFVVDSQDATVTTPVQSNYVETPAGTSQNTFENNTSNQQTYTVGIDTTYTDTTTTTLSAGVSAGLTVSLGTQQTTGCTEAKVQFNESLTASLLGTLGATSAITQTTTVSYPDTEPLTLEPGQTVTAQFMYTIGSVINYWEAPGYLQGEQGYSVVTNYDASNYTNSGISTVESALQDAINYGIPIASSINPSEGSIVSGGSINMGTGYNATVVYYNDTTSTSSIATTSDNSQSNLNKTNTAAFLKAATPSAIGANDENILVSDLIASLKTRSIQTQSPRLVGSKEFKRLDGLVKGSQINPVESSTIKTSADGQPVIKNIGYRLINSKDKVNNLSDESDYMLNTNRKNFVTSYLHSGTDVYYGNGTDENISAVLNGGSKRIETGAGKDIVFLMDAEIDSNSLAAVNLGSGNDIFYQKSTETQTPSPNFVNRITLGDGVDHVLLEGTAMIDITDFQLGIDKLEWDKDYQVSIEGDATLLTSNDGTSKVYLRGAIPSLLTRGDESINQLARLNPGIFSSSYGGNQNDFLSLYKALSTYGLTNTINTSWKEIQASKEKSNNYIQTLASVSGVNLDKQLTKKLLTSLKKSSSCSDFMYQFGQVTNAPKPEWALNSPPPSGSSLMKPSSIINQDLLLPTSFNESLVAATDPYSFYNSDSTSHL